MQNKPNLFKIATSELSQDAFLTWLIKWADKSNKKCDEELFNCAQEFVKHLISKQLPYEKPITKSNSDRQWKKIDVWAKINEEVFIIIEDKTFTGEHSNQLERYKITAQEYCDKENLQLICIYLKTGTEAKSSLEKIESKGFSVVERKDLLDMFLFYKDKTNNAIFCDFVDKLQEMEMSENSFEFALIKDWNKQNSWVGFYRYLETQINVEGWNYLNNKSGGFLGLWWHSLDWKKFTVYLQIEQDDLCFKISNVNEKRKEVRNELHNIIMLKAGEENKREIVKPQRFVNKACMTVAKIHRKDWLGPDEAVIDKDKVVNKLKEYEKFLEKLIC